jgi:hypothetical protein
MAEQDRTPNNDKTVGFMMEYYKSEAERKREQEKDPVWREHNMEYDLRCSTIMCEKVRNNNYYAQNLYAAMCNNKFVKLDVMPILENRSWSCSCRYSGGIIADMLGFGDYIDWYCSGIHQHIEENEQEDWTDDQRKQYQYQCQYYVIEGKITKEIRSDLQELGWVPLPGGDWEKFEQITG